MMCGLALCAVMLFQATPPSSKAEKPLPDRLKSLEESVDRLWDFVDGRMTKIDCNTSNYVELHPENSALVFPVACEKIEPYLEGYKITVAIGNPYSLTYVNVAGTLYYWESALGKTAKFETTLLPGQWNKAVVTVNPASASSVRDLVLQFRLNSARSRLN